MHTGFLTLGSCFCLAFQCSRRGGELKISVRSDGRVDIAGQTAVVLKGNLTFWRNWHQSPSPLTNLRDTLIMLVLSQLRQRITTVLKSLWLLIVHFKKLLESTHFWSSRSLVFFTSILPLPMYSDQWKYSSTAILFFCF